MSSYNDSGEGQRSARRQIIEEAQVVCHTARSEYQQVSKLNDGEVPREISLRFQQAVTDYYWSLRPLRDEQVVQDFWESTVLSEDWTYEEVVVKGSVEADLHKPGIQISREPQTIEKPYLGLETIKTHLDGEFETKTVVKTGARGRREETVRRQKILEPEILLDISGVLDDAAAKLGFMPDVKQKDPKDSPNMGDLRGLLVDRGQTEAAEKLPIGED
ncbi:hypothetical protein [Natrinema sp. DC36]|uniref:hypothetical protein n=1 Tax=Natrinema sp. DC36 TaxID=2878680 RepID=UPI001CF0D2F6|nr:hypothetical protein [Natrinema sp. DC36]